MAVRVAVGPVASVSDATCVSVGDGRAIVVRVGDELRAYENRCLHQDSRLEGAWVRDGVVSCPLHFWRYRVDDGTHLGGRRALLRYPVEIVDGEAFVVLPDPDPPTSLRDELLARARTYDRDEAWQAQQQQQQ